MRNVHHFDTSVRRSSARKTSNNRRNNDKDVNEVRRRDLLTFLAGLDGLVESSCLYESKLKIGTLLKENKNKSFAHS